MVEFGPENENVEGLSKEAKAKGASGDPLLEDMHADLSEEVAQQSNGNPPELQKPAKPDDLISRTLAGKHGGSEVVSEQPSVGPGELSEIEVLLGDEELMDDVIARILKDQGLVQELLEQVIGLVADSFQLDDQFRGKLIAAALADRGLREMVKRDLIADTS